MTDAGQTKKRKRLPKGESAADLIPDDRSRPVVYDYTVDDIQRIEGMARVGLCNEDIAHILGMNPRTFDRHIAAQKELFDKGDTAERFNLYAALQRGKAQAGWKIASTAFDVATKDRNVPMLMWLTKVRLGWREKIEVEASVKKTVIYETELVGGVIKQQKKVLEGEEIEAIDAIIDEVTEELCPTLPAPIESDSE